MQSALWDFLRLGPRGVRMLGFMEQGFGVQGTKILQKFFFAGMVLEWYRVAFSRQYRESISLPHICVFRTFTYCFIHLLTP